MGLLGNGWNDPQSGANMALAAGLLRGDLGAGLLGASTSYQQAQQNALKKQYMDAQMQNMQSEIEARKLKTIQDQRQQKLMESFFPGLFGGTATPPGVVPGVLGAPAASGVPAPGGAALPTPPAPGVYPAAKIDANDFFLAAQKRGLGSDNGTMNKIVGYVNQGYSVDSAADKVKQESGGSSAAPAAAGNSILEIAKQYGIPIQAIQADIVFNGGKKISELLDKHGSPDMQVTNGYAYDKNRLPTGFVPGYNVSQDGKVTVTTPGANGVPVTSAAPGSIDTFRQFEDVKNRSAAGSAVEKVWNPQLQRYELQSRSQVLDAADPGTPVVRQPATPEAGLRTQVRGDMGATPADYDREIAASTQALQTVKDPGSRAQLQAHIQEMQRQKATYGGPMAAEPSVNEATNAAAGKEQAVQTAKDVAEQRKGIMNAGFVAPTNIAKYQQIGKLLQDVDGGTLTATGTNLASLANSLGIKIDKNLPNKQAAMSLANEAALQLRNPAGGAGMPGAMSDSDRTFLASMTPNMSQTAEGRRMVIQSYVAVQQRNQQVAQFARKYEQKHGRLDNGFFDQLQAWSSANPLFKGQ